MGFLCLVSFIDIEREYISISLLPPVRQQGGKSVRSGETVSVLLLCLTSQVSNVSFPDKAGYLTSKAENRATGGQE